MIINQELVFPNGDENSGAFPPYVQIRSTNSAQILIDSRRRQDKEITSEADLFIPGQISLYNANKIAFTDINWQNTIPNVNKLNNRICIISSNTGATIHCADVQEGFYNTVATLSNTIETA